MSSDSKHLALQNEVFLSSLYRLVNEIGTVPKPSSDFAQGFKSMVMFF
jgi:hypothetical protein